MAQGETVQIGKPFNMPAGCTATTYFVSLVFQHASDATRLYLATHIEMVSGCDPLTQDEVMARSRKAISAQWKEQKPSLGDELAWNLAMYVVRNVVKRPA